jgi:hypothetical protein
VLFFPQMKPEKKALDLNENEKNYFRHHSKQKNHKPIRIKNTSWTQ